MAKCNFCESEEIGNGNIYAEEFERGIMTQLIYWGRGEMDISGGVYAVDDLQVTKTVKINYCPICGRDLIE